MPVFDLGEATRSISKLACRFGAVVAFVGLLAATTYTCPRRYVELMFRIAPFGRRYLPPHSKGAIYEEIHRTGRGSVAGCLERRRNGREKIHQLRRILRFHEWGGDQCQYVGCRS